MANITVLIGVCTCEFLGRGPPFGSGAILVRDVNSPAIDVPGNIERVGRP
jgi:hypothetical protein